MFFFFFLFLSITDRDNIKIKVEFPSNFGISNILLLNWLNENKCRKNVRPLQLLVSFGEKKVINIGKTWMLNFYGLCIYNSIFRNLKFFSNFFFFFSCVPITYTDKFIIRWVFCESHEQGTNETTTCLCHFV